MNGAILKGRARQLPTRLVEKVWGRANLPPPFEAPANTRIGEIWFEPPPEMPDLLVKYLFTSEKLSVQVHPSVVNAKAGEAGKEECWLVLDAKPGARLAIGFDESHSAAAIEAAARDGSIEDLLTWHEVASGDIFYLPAGTVHAIGPGLALVEVQQNSDTTFRLYDYGRPRSLHLERALAVAHRTPYQARHKGHVADKGPELLDGPFFRMDRIEGEPDAATLDLYSDGALALPLDGGLSLHDGSGEAGPGACLYAPSLASLDFSAARVTLLTRSK
ncbi:MAG: class I mannose-6-phosphate isomerase [Erythrobacter sp.]|nr:class I mannose-6-phosphate isomerase [Erythrobacter sp.]